MFVEDNLIEYTKIHLYLQRVFGTCCLDFSPDQKLVVSVGKNVKKELKKTVFALLYCFGLYLQYIHSIKQEEFATGLENLFFATMFCGLSLIKWLSLSRRFDLATLFNQFLQFESRQLPRKSTIVKNCGSKKTNPSFDLNWLLLLQANFTLTTQSD